MNTRLRRPVPAPLPLPWIALILLLACAGTGLGVQLVGASPALFACGGAAVVLGLAAALAARRLAGDSARAGTRGARALLRRAQRSRAAGRPREALEDLQEALRLQPDCHEAALGVWQLCRELGRGAEISRALMRVIHIELRRGLDGALEHWQALTDGGIPLEVPPGLMVSASLALRERGRNAEAAHVLRCALERSEDRDSRTLAAHIARAARGLDPELVETAAWRALGSMEISLEQRQALEDLIAEVIPLRRAPARARAIAVVDAVLLGVSDEGLDIETAEGRRERVRWERVEAVALVAVEDLGPKRVMLLDLALNWSSAPGEPLRVIRLRDDRSAELRLPAAPGPGAEALRELMETILERSRAAPLPDEDSALGRPFATFADRESYQRAVLGVEGMASGA